MSRRNPESGRPCPVGNVTKAGELTCLGTVVKHQNVCEVETIPSRLELPEVSLAMVTVDTMGSRVEMQPSQGKDM